jgi:hypothetical protein
MNLFKDLLPSILQAKNPLLETQEDFEQYPPHTINKALSYYPDCLFFVQEMNKNPHLTRKMQHDFYFYGLRKFKRPFPGKWAKKTEDANYRDIEAVMNALECSYEKACSVLPLLSDENLVKLREESNVGGRI